MENLPQLLNDLGEIRKIFIVTYGPNGKSALIQSLNKETNIKCYMSTNDGNSILTSIDFPQNNLLKLVISTIKSHSTRNGDNCKTLFFYQFTCLNVLSTYIHQQTEQVISYLRFNSINQTYQVNLNTINTFNNLTLKSIIQIKKLLLDEWLNILQNENPQIKTCIKTSAEFLNLLPNLAVINDLYSFNDIFSEISSQLVIDLIAYFTPDDIDLLANTLIQIEKDFETCFICCDRRSLSGSRLFTEGFLIQRRFLLKQASLFDGSEVRLILLIQNTTDTDNSGSSFVRIDKDLNENMFQCFTTGDQFCFSNDFLESLKLNGINLILTSGALTDLKKSQLNSINCSLIAYVDSSLIAFLSHRLGIKGICPRSNDPEVVRKNIVNVKSIEQLEDDLFYFRLNNVDKKKIKIAFIQLCAPSKMFHHVFKAYFHKCFRTISNLFEPLDTKNTHLKHILLDCGHFESITNKIFQNLQQNAKFTKERLLFKYLSGVFHNLDMSLNNRGLEKVKRLGNCEDLIGMSRFKSSRRYEPFMLKLKCFIESIQLLKSICRIGKVYHFCRRLEEVKLCLTSEDEEL